MVTITKEKSSTSRTTWYCRRAAIPVLLLLLLFVKVQYYEEDSSNHDNREDTNMIRGSDQQINIPACKEEDQKRDKEASSPPAPERDFFEIAQKTGTDKVEAHIHLPLCLKDPANSCLGNSLGTSDREACRPWGHFYDTIYNRWLKKYSTDNAEPAQFLEIGFFTGKGFEAYSEFMPRLEKHTMEISCMEPGGKWPEKWGNFASKSPDYEALRAAKRLHCGDASEYDFLHKIWTTEMKRPDAPPLKIVVDDASHIDYHMATSLFFWFPRIEPGGILVVEDIQPSSESNRFRTHILPQVMKDLHWCGDHSLKDTRCFPTIQPLLAGVHCEMHICVFLRNDVASMEPDEEASMPPKDAFTNAQKCLFGPHE
mmetsp:Transcript_16358/g.23863  ORF Transcript_16358/g.23863 Transcript_16358/m.23863 type:complete len:369 (+) Transcript_16358:92-1198(+)|eukprot:CAMPEP_0197254562 /NCGR_PEP_ID=MMETSP1429-20130617/69087_1 /TAXON_ID=49237 /ORGANISM="Chaetoceros  sp., Strain UNC1202" /LENGTH=368 /DNA_ID=CAMNT_0042717593 /DNA_START=77 /DNA_END=1183 /DNA_ORIENTATION=-